jgi:hypothetical protein
LRQHFAENKAYARHKGGELELLSTAPNDPLTNSMVGSVKAFADERQREERFGLVEWI